MCRLGTKRGGSTPPSRSPGAVTFCISQLPTCYLGGPETLNANRHKAPTPHSCRRVNFPALCMFITLWHFTVYCPLAHMVWTPQGLVHSYGVIDFAVRKDGGTPPLGVWGKGIV